MVHISHIIKWSQDADEEDNLCFYILCRTQKDDSIASLQQKQTNKQKQKKTKTRETKNINLIHTITVSKHCFARQNKLAGLVVHVITFFGFFSKNLYTLM